MSITFNKPNKTRIFITQNKEDYFKIFSFEQKKDGSIYCGWPSFSDTKWISVTENSNELKLRISETPSNSSKLSLHGSGVVKFKQNDFATDENRIKGSHLINFERSQIGARHLFTSFICEPTDLSPDSPFGKKSGDSPIYTHALKPFVLACFAIPQQATPLKIHFQPSFSIDLFEQDFSKDIGFGNFSLAYHDIFWFAYRTKNMDRWPKSTHIFYHDGFFCPDLSWTIC